MPLVKETLKAQLKADFKGIDLGNEDASDRVAEILADRFDAYIKSATVSVNVTTTVTGVCATPAGPGTTSGAGTGSGTGTIS